MRQIGTLPDEQQARRFEDYLLTLDVDVMVEPESPTAWAVWVYDEDHLEQAKEELSQFAASPDEARYHKAASQADKLRDQAEKQREKTRKQQVNVRERWERPAYAQCPVTFGMIAISVMVALGTQLGGKHEPVGKALSIAGYEKAGNMIQWRRLEEVKEGQVWRLVTPIFLHFGIMHILFNMLWLRDLGTSIEFRRGSRRFAFLVFTIALTSNLGQYLVSGSPAFGGMSGVVFGLFGYTWMKSKFEPESGFFIHPNVVFMMMAWFAICFTGYVGPIANAAHGIGLAVGAVMGRAGSLFKRIS